MPSLTTVYRAIVMVAAGIIIVKGWQYCGPSGEQVKAVANRAAEIGRETWRRLPSPAESGPHVSAIPSTTAPPAERHHSPIAAAPASFPASVVEPAAFTQNRVPNQAAVEAPPMFPQPAPSEELFTGTSGKSSNLSAADANSLTMLLTRLKELGGIEPALEPWGSSGNLYRFCCRATLAGSPQINRHFEAVAAEQLVAVENVIAKVQSWRAERERSHHE